MINPISNNSMYSLINQTYANKYQAPSQGGQTSGGTGLNSDMLQKALKWNNALRDLTSVSQALYVRSFELQSLMKIKGAGNITGSGSFAVSSSNPLIGTRIIGNVTPGTFNVNVSQVAKKMEVKSDKITDINAALNLEGNFKINDTIFDVTKDMSITNIKDLINSKNAGVTASIIDNELHVVSNIEGAAGAFTMSDITSNENTLTNSDSNVATVTSLLSNADWSHDIEVVQLAENLGSISESYSDSFDTWDPSKYTTTGTWKNDDPGYVNTSVSNTPSELFYDTSDYGNTKTVTATFNSMSDKAHGAVYLDYVDQNNYVKLDVQYGSKTITLTKNVNGVQTNVTSSSLMKNQGTLKLSLSRDDAGNFSGIVTNGTGSVYGTISANWNDAKTGGNAGIMAIASPIATIKDDMAVDSFSVQGTKTVQQDAVYKVDGVEYTSSANDIVIGDGTTNQASVTLNNVGQTTITNTLKNSVLTSIGILNGQSFTDSNIAVVDSVTKDTDWSVDINVTKLANDVTVYQNDFISTNLSDFTIQNNNYSVSNGQLNVTQSTGSGDSVMLLNGSENQSENRTVSFDFQMTSGKSDTGIVMSETSDGYLAVGMSGSSSGRVTLYYDDYTTGMEYSIDYYLSSPGSLKYHLETTTDDQGNIGILVKDSANGNVLGDFRTTALEFIGKNVDLSGKAGIVSIGPLVDTTKVIDNFKIVEHQKAEYTVGGITYTSSTNDNISLKDSVTEEELAKIDLTGIGQTTIRNGNLKHLVQNAQDAIYSINGGANTSSSTNIVTYNGVEMTFNDKTTSPVTITTSQGSQNSNENGGSSNNTKIERIINFVAEYNAMVQVIKGYNDYFNKKFVKGMEDAYTRNHSALAGIGITKNSDGTLKIDKNKLVDKMTSETFDIEKVFLGNGRIGQLMMDTTSIVIKNPEKYMEKLTFNTGNVTTQTMGTILNQYF